MDLLNSINSPADLKALSIEELERLAAQIRAELVSVLARNGGHLASNLGVVELTVALHSVFNSPRDKIIWDVGHQSYVHKLLTGRRSGFHTIRQLGGLSGYCRREESPHDPFGAGHGSTSISAALGFAVARDALGGTERIVAVIGDGALTGGMAFEALNAAGHLKTDVLVVLNDNEMSIAKNVGGLASYLSRLRTDPHYLKARQDFEALARSLPMGRSIVDVVERLKASVKHLVLPGMLFEELGFTYLGPVDGHSIPALRRALEEADRLRGPVLLHVHTVKGKGYPPAEKDAVRFHGCPPFDVDSGDAMVDSGGPITYTQAFAKALVRLASQDERIVAVTAAMPEGTGLSEFGRRFPKRLFDVGMAEEHAVTFAAGMAAAGLRPVVAIYSTFLQRSYDQILHDVALQNLPVTFCLDRAGLVGDDGPTHHGAFDLSYLRTIPGIVVMAPADENELGAMLKTALAHPGPVAIRYPRSPGRGVPIEEDPEPIPIGRSVLLRPGREAAILAVGSMVGPALEAAGMLAQAGIDAAVVNVRCVRPLDEALLVDLADRIPLLVTVEENSVVGGFGSAVLEALNSAGRSHVRVIRLGLPDAFVEHGSRQLLLKMVGLSAEGIRDAVVKALGCTGRPTPDLQQQVLTG
ncbi:MAG: 1-deoxy-D-xylulose-5-phosphate synthase [Armatimonadota bacterium]